MSCAQSCSDKAVQLRYRKHTEPATTTLRRLSLKRKDPCVTDLWPVLGRREDTDRAQSSPEGEGAVI